MARAATALKALHPAYKAILGLVAPVCTILGTLLALNVIHPFGSDALAASVDRTTEATTAAIRVAYTSEAARFEANGRFHFPNRTGTLRYDFTGTPGAEGLDDVVVVFDRRHVYMRLLPGVERPWIHADLETAHELIADYAEAAGRQAPPPELASLGDLDFQDPSQALAQLRRATDVEDLGEERVFGVPARKYQGVVEPREAGGQRLLATAWIDGGELIRRLTLRTDGGAAFEVTMEFTEFGEPVDVRTPRPDEVRELDSVLEGMAF